MSQAPGGRITSTPTQHAVRLLTLLGVCGDPAGGSDPSDATKVVRSEKKLQAMDFWLRNPDYLADEIISLVHSGRLPADRIEVARRLLSDPEPQLHRIPMPKWLFGAYEKIDNAFTTLEAYGLAYVRRVGRPPHVARSDFFLTQDGLDAVGRLDDEPVLGWYPQQARLVAEIVGEDGGDQLKNRQYAQAEYAGTELGVHIGSIAPRVQDRLDALTAPHIDGSTR